MRRNIVGTGQWFTGYRGVFWAPVGGRRGQQFSGGRIVWRGGLKGWRRGSAGVGGGPGGANYQNVMR